MNAFSPEMMLKRLLAVVVSVVLAVLSSLTVSCGHKEGQPSVDDGAPRVQAVIGSGLATNGRAVGAGSKPALQSDGARAGLGPAPAIRLTDVLSGIDAYPAPKGVSADTWTTLTAELKRLLVARAGGSKTISTAPVALIDKVTDLRAASNRAGTQATLTWTEALPGDCNNDGVVDITDLQPIAAHYGEKSTGPGSPAYLADADGDGQVGITDLQPVAANYMAHLQGYRVYRGRHPVLTTTWEQPFRPNVADPTNTDWSVDRPSPPPATSRPTYTYTDDISSLTDKEYVRYKVVPYGDGSEGIAGSEVMMVPPSYWVVSGTITDADIGGGVDGVLVTITPGGLTGTTGKDGTYAIGGVQNGNYTVTATKEFYTFAPTTANVTVSTADLPGVNFAATLHAHTISGKLAYPNGVGLPGAMVTASPGGQTATTAADGSYTITRILQGSFSTVTPAKIGFLFSPPNRAVTMSTTDVSGVNFAVAPPAWPKFHANAQNTGLSPYVGAQTNALRWSSTMTYSGQGAQNSPAIGSDGTVYIGSYYSVYALNPTDGSVRWSYATGGGVSSPAIGADGTVYVGSIDKNVYALNPSDGSVRWKYTTYWSVENSPAIGADGTVYIGSDDGYIYALNPANGSVKWKYHTGDAVRSSPAIGADGTVYVGGVDGNVYALNPANGSVKWSYNTGGEVYSSPAIGADGTVYISSGYNMFAVYALNPTDGSMKWSHATGGGGSPAIGADGTVYVGSNDGNLYALNPADGSVKWSCATGGSPDSASAIGADGTIYIGSFDRKVYALNPADGSVKWSYTTGGPVSGLPAIGVDGTVYIGSSDGKFYAFGA